MDELFVLAGLLGVLGERAGEPSVEPVGARGEGGVSSCGYYVVRRGFGAPPGDVHGLDSHTSVVEFEGVSVIVATGALVGRVLATVPGVAARWLGVRLNFRGGVELLEGSGLYYRSEVLGVPFDAGFDLEAARDEVRYHVEGVLAGIWDGGGVLLVDGPVFRVPDVYQSGGGFFRLYLELARARAALLRGAVGVVKRVERSRYLARCAGVGSDDEVAARRLLNNSPGYVGPVVVEWEGLRKYLFYVASPAPRGVRVFRVEALEEGLAEEAASWLGSLSDASGLPLPLAVADRVARRLNAAAVKLLYAASPVEPTYRGLEVVQEALGEL
ncbi:DNA double-strand break repair nuclease NurA [Pyrobaculum sp.]|uniref:DNA double-strand break repair nuclease NurA n=2 Tax=Pyrobaculum sp. TaxID=2004705 RepID=UPI00316A66EC